MAPIFGSPVKHDYLRTVRKNEPWPLWNLGRKSGHFYQFGIKNILVWFLSPFPNATRRAPPFENPSYATERYCLRLV